MPPTLVITRPRARAVRFAETCRAMIGRDIPILIAPVVEINIKKIDVDFAAYGALIITSEAGVDAINWPASLPRPKVYAVGAHTAKLAQSAGFEAVDGGGNADALVETLIAASPDGQLLHLHGAETRGDIRSRLLAAGLRVDACVSYSQRDVELPSSTIDVLQGSTPAILPVFSVRSAQRVLKYAPASTHQLVAISGAVARAWSSRTNVVHVAANATAISMAQSIAALYEED